MDEFDFEHAGLSFRCIVEQDTDIGPPWEENDGHGSIRTVYAYHSQPSKKPGEVIIHSERGDHWIYDYSGAVETAKRDGWGFSGMDRATMSAGQIAAEAVRRDMRYCREWLRGDRCWAQIEVFRIDADGERMGESEYLGGIDSGYSREDRDYLRQCAEELAGQIVDQARKAWREALREVREARYWAARDVDTVGA